MVLCRCRLLLQNKSQDILNLKFTTMTKHILELYIEILHTIRGTVGTGERLTELEHKGIDTEFKGWKTGDTKHILVCPSSQMVTYNIKWYESR